MTDLNWLLLEAAPSDDERVEWWRTLPSPALAERRISDPSKYIPADGLLDAFNAALILGQPLLLTGDPGCGKTEAAHYLAWRLGLDRPSEKTGSDAALRFDVKSTTTAKDLFYSFDVVRRFYAAQMGEDTNPVKFLKLNALGRAIFEVDPTVPADLRSDLLLDEAALQPRRSVVLIDEIDKAPRDVPNDLLVEFEKLRFHLPEIDRTISAAAALRPILVLTSNRERDLPDAFLRRCIVFTVPFPEKSLRDIVHGRIAGVSEAVTGEAVNLTVNLRKSNVRRKPGTAELISFVAAIKGLGLAASASVRTYSPWTQIARTTLLKNSHDHETVSDAALLGYLNA